MLCRRAALAVLLVVVVVSCGGAPAATPTTAPVVPPPSAAASPMVTPPPEPPTPAPTALPAPPEPSGLAFSRCCGEGNGDKVSSLAWEEPRTEGVEIRVYGVTTCLPPEDAADETDETCLGDATALPDGILVQLASGPASGGALSWFQDEGDEVSVGEGCAGTAVNEEGTPYYAVVARAHGASGQSAPAIVDPGYFYNEPCYSDGVE